MTSPSCFVDSGCGPFVVRLGRRPAACHAPEDHIAWFARYGDRIRGGADLAWPKVIRTVRRRSGQPVTMDGPFIEGKELLGGVIIIEVDGWEEAIRMAGEWPSLLQGPGAGVQVEAVTDH